MKQALWDIEFDEPMPDGMTYKQFALKRDKKWLSDEIRDQSDIVAGLKEAYKKNPLPPILELYQNELTRLNDLYKKRVAIELNNHK